MLPKQIVTDFYYLCFEKKQPRAAFERFVAETLVQHNPVVADGAEPALASLETHLRENPEIHFSIHRIVAEGDLVVVHALVKNDQLDRGRAVVDIFRVEDERIVEHWDV
ncbi:MAG: nuclear transport factor 2 family protein, partial [Verrucomicrobia bacterium]|nr:nuclear transport factor 2 family protein [Verrucomicrobiota bacterium]